MNLTATRLLLPALLAAALALTGCSGGDNADSGGSSSSAPDAASLAQRQDGAAGSDVAAAAPAPANAKAGARTDSVVVQEQALIRKGNVELRAADVGRARIDVQKVVDRYAGQVTDEKTQSDDDGRATYTRMVLRIPSADFTQAVTALKGVAELESAKTSQDDVTGEVIDVRSRLGVQKRSIARISVLFQQAKSIRDIMAIEAELSQRQADLESLESQAAYLADQTSQSTIVVSIDQIPKKKASKDHDEAGFLAGLSAGWGALSTFAVGLATAAGAVLPWLVVVALVAIPTMLLVRSLRRRRTPALVPADSPQSSE